MQGYRSPFQNFGFVKIENLDLFWTTVIQNSGLFRVGSTKIGRIYEEGSAGSGDVNNKNASNVDDLELAKQLQSFIELEDAPLKRKLTNPMPPGATTPSLRRAMK